MKSASSMVPCMRSLLNRGRESQRERRGKRREGEREGEQKRESKWEREKREREKG